MKGSTNTNSRSFFLMLFVIVILFFSTSLDLSFTSDGIYDYNLASFTTNGVAAAEEDSADSELLVPLRQPLLKEEDVAAATSNSKTCETPVDADPEFEQRFRDKCGYWIKKVTKWKQLMAKKKKFPKFYAHQERSGTGDRLAGSMTAFSTAMKTQNYLELRWTNIDKVFKPSCLLNNEYDSQNRPLVVLNGTRKRLGSGTCRLGTWYQCKIVRHNRDRCPVYNRACLDQSSCGELVDTYGKQLNMGNVIGCPIRILFQPKLEFLNHEVSWDIDNRTVNGTLAELVAVMKKYETIAMHLRLGDALMSKKVEGLPNSSHENSVVKHSQNCANMVDSHISSVKPVRTKKEIKWIVASDDQRVRNYYRESFPGKVIILKSRPRHVQIVRKIAQEEGAEAGLEAIRDLFAEWYIIGKADHLISNKAHKFGVSAFSRSAWTYNLKSQYYEVTSNHPATNCRRKEFYYHGNSVSINQICKNPSNLLRINQSHLIESNEEHF
mmetsp:Transcript_9657/g.12622  ORF Transcript_9657/g.12622 Transcript_9657/m.12622 type:complete len:494 (-) Transcript_9657:53-1534(-)